MAYARANPAFASSATTPGARNRDGCSAKPTVHAASTKTAPAVYIAAVSVRGSAPPSSSRRWRQQDGDQTRGVSSLGAEYIQERRGRKKQGRAGTRSLFVVVV